VSSTEFYKECFQKEIIIMNKQRAQEIATSSILANVTYNEVPIYIQNVNENNETARIYPLDEPENEQNVPLTNLIEH
jgi:small acid-soluble spore protein H (minor)